MGGKGAIRVVIEAVDRITSPIQRIAGSVRSMLRGMDLDRVKEQVGKVVTAFTNLASAASNTAMRIAAVTLGLIGAMTALTRSVANATEAQTRSARAVNMSLASYQGLAHAANLVGGTSEEMAGALSSLQDKALEAARGNSELRRGFRLMGVSLRDARGQMRPTADIMDDVADAFARIPDSARRTEAATILFGSAAVALLPILRGGSAGLRAAREDARRLGLTMTEADRQGLANFNRSMVRVSGAVQGVQNAIATRLAPVLTPMLNQFAEWIASNRELIATRIEEWVTGAVRALQEFDFAGLARDLREAVTQALAFIEQIGGWKAVLIGVGAVITGPFILSLVQLAGVLTMTLLPPLSRAAALLGSLALVRLPAAVLSLLGAGGAAGAAAGAAGTAGATAATAATGAAAAGTGAAAAAGTAATGAGGILGALAPLAAILGGAFAAATIITAAEDPRVRADTRANGGTRWRERGVQSGFGGESANEIQRRLDAEDAARGRIVPPSGQPVQPVRPTAAQRVDAGGTLTIRLRDERTEITGRPNDPRMRIEVDPSTGPYMAGPG